MEIEKGMLVVAVVEERDYPKNRRGHCLGIVKRETLVPGKWEVYCGSFGTYSVPQEKLFPLVRLQTLDDWRLTPGEALRKYLDEVIIALAWHISQVMPDKASELSSGGRAAIAGGVS